MIQLKNNINVIKHRKKVYIVAASLIIVGLAVGFIRGFNFGMDFTGGSMIQIDMKKEVPVGEIQDILKTDGIDAEIIHAGEKNEQIIIRTPQALMSEERDALYDKLFTKYGLDKSSIITSEIFGPSVGETLKKKSIQAVIIACIGILAYIAVRFEWKFGVAAIVALLHDILLMIAFYGFFHLPINSPFIASLLIIFGYSVSDTVVIFDRIRENLKIHKKMKTEELIDMSVTQTVVRSIATSVTTLLAILALFIMGVESIRQFTLPLIIGILAGAGSSIFIASPVWYELVQMTKKSKYKGK